MLEALDTFGLERGETEAEVEAEEVEVEVGGL